MAGIRALDQIGAKWARVAAQSGPSYEEGISSPTRDYAAGATAANDAWKNGVQQAVAGDRFKTGVQRAGNAKWQRNALAKGPARFAQGVQTAQPDYTSGFAPYREAIQATTLPPRGARRSPQNLQRVSAIVTALSAKKEAMMRGSR